MVDALLAIFTPVHVGVFAVILFFAGILGVVGTAGSLNGPLLTREELRRL